ncbi:unnamed protein product [Phytomonas sp. Hart1]|nr:unnamed protein product [Phytomonas sp. Hart1]|eukprot:CCW68028.1 unnamed protein product [Phytomonas sp. isolate Hart1]
MLQTRFQHQDHPCTSPSPTTRDDTRGALECLICVGPCRVVCVFSCGHYACYACGLRIHTLGEGGCPVCRVRSSEVILTRTISKDEDHYTAEEIAALSALSMPNKRLNCLIDGQELANEMEKLYQNLCPIEGCWMDGEQDPFIEFGSLKDHLAREHGMSYCDICLKSRPVFLCEQMVYGEVALQQHLEGICQSDSPSFIGHSPCRFCSRLRREVRLYDGEALLKHMQEHHYTCDVCNRGQFTFTFYENRQKLDQHFVQCHKICEHSDCANLDIMLRVFADDFELMLHKKRMHNVKCKLTFTPATFGALTEGNDVSSRGGRATAPQAASSNPFGLSTGSNMNAIQITFDHIFRKEVVDLFQRKSNTRGKHKWHNHTCSSKGGAGKAYVYAPLENGLPLHFHHPNVLKVLVWPPDHLCSNSPHECTSPTQRNKGVEGRDFDCAFSMPESVESYLQRNHIPSDPAEQAQRLDELVSKNLTSPVDYARFRNFTRNFMDSKIFAIEYYNTISEFIFPQTDIFNAIFPLLVATMPNFMKKRALCEIWKIKMAPELQRRARAKERDEREAKKKEEEKRTAALLNSISTRRGASKKPNPKPPPGAKNAWMCSDIKSKLGHSESEALEDVPYDSVEGESYAFSSPSFGGGESTTTIPLQSLNDAKNTLGSALNSESLYPSLPRDNMRNIHTKKKKQPQLQNAWFRK